MSADKTPANGRKRQDSRLGGDVEVRSELVDNRLGFQVEDLDARLRGST